MKRNWYIICTKAKQESKVLARLARKGIECYCPYSNREIKTGTKTTKEYLPVFSSYVFAYISTIEIQNIKRIPSVINLAHWQSEPVMMTKEEIEAIKLMEDNYINIRLEKSQVSMVDEVTYMVDSNTSYSDNFVSIKPQRLSIVLPTLGYTMTAERANVNINTNKTVVRKKFSFAGLFSF